MRAQDWARREIVAIEEGRSETRRLVEEQEAKEAAARAANLAAVESLEIEHKREVELLREVRKRRIRICFYPFSLT